MLRKFAAFEVLEATLAPANDPLGLQRYAHRHHFTYEPRPGYLYIRSRAISSRTNDNFDTFPAEEIKASYKTFIGKPVFVNHNNDNHRRARGVIIDAALHEDRNPDGSPDTWSEVLMEVDAVRFPKLAKAILDGHIDRTSMGTDVAFSKCSFCGNKATTPLEYCKHIPKMKGQRIYRTTASGKKEGVLVSEICHGLKFFENSLLVEEPADPTAFFTGVDDHSGHRTASLQNEAGAGLQKQPLIEGHWTHHDSTPRADGSFRASCQCGYLGPARDNHVDAYADKLEHGSSSNPDYNLERIQQRMVDAQSPKPVVPKTPEQSQQEANQDKHYRSWTGTDPANWALANKTSAYDPELAARQQAFRDQQDAHRKAGLCDCKGSVRIEPHAAGAHAEWATKAHAEGKTDPWGEPLHQAFDGHGAWNCNNRSCAEHPQHLYDEKPGAQGTPGWMLHEHDPHKDLTREVGKAFHEQGLTEDAHYLLDQQHDGPSKYSARAPLPDSVDFQGRTLDRATDSLKSVDTRKDKERAYAVGVNMGRTDRAKNQYRSTTDLVPHADLHPAHAQPHFMRGWQDGFGGSGDTRTASMVYLSTERKKISQMSPEEVKAFRKHQESGRRWNRQNPAHADNIIAHWNACTPHERHAGMNWYADAHETTKHIARDTKTPMHVAAGLMSNYSPQTHWATNMLNAAKAMRTKKGIGGKGSGVFATASQKSRAQTLMGKKRDHSDAKHYDEVLDGPKTHAFAHLIHHGGNADPSNPKVVVDRHALSVACGKRARDIDYEMSGLGGKKRYKQVADEYHKAAQHITKHTGVKVEAHQVQAATWLARQRLNAGEDAKMASYGKISNDATHEWNQYAGEHHPLAMGKEPGTGYSSPKDAPEDVVHSNDLAAEGHHGTLHAAVPPTNPQRKSRTEFGRTAGQVYLAYGETKAPQDVDTLRDEECPVCGEADAYDGNRCDVCGFDAPPKMFQDPDLDMAKQLDLRKDIMQDEFSDPNGDGFPDVIPGHGSPGDEAPPPGAGMVPDPQDVAQQQMNEIGENQAPLEPGMLDENGQPIAPPDPMAQDMPMDPNALPMEPDDIAGDDGQGQPGTPGDMAADLVCPACGFQQGAEPPQSTDMDDTPSAVAGAEGALCPQCQSAPLMSIQDMDQMNTQVGMPPTQVRTSASLAFPVITL